MTDPSPVRIRSAVPRDAPALARGMRSVIEEGDFLATQRSTSVVELEERFTKGIAADHVIVVGDDARAIVACTGIHPTAIGGVWSLGTWVLPRYRRRGLARAMIERIFGLARERGIRKVELEAFSDNDAAVALYGACGFEIEGERRDHYLREDGSVKSAVVMAAFP
jgi:RimJ/RimL family protein N-acetyltransferase